ncbi:Rim9 protein [Saccharomycopsis crataegensis]|uniref:Rim9 protein n=1 Tax=Saccharomycopsis crataegensis TaxID=43959 RepID=A0AAV5QLH3_9ASCO|nr:Rim9 protein [Saccharomycopsis crataegensis]
MVYKAALVVTGLLLVALGLQILPVISVPITTSISLCSYDDDYKFGMFGYCYSHEGCSSVQIGYPNSILQQLTVFSLPWHSRSSLSKLLIVHPIACGFTLVLFISTIFLQFDSYSLGLLSFLLVWGILSFLVCLFSFLVDILLFSPHLSWCGWVVLGSTILIAICTIGLFIMRKETSSRIKMNKNNENLNNINNRYSLHGFEYDMKNEHYDNHNNGNSFSANSRDELVHEKPSLQSFVNQENSLPQAAPTSYLKVNSANFNDILTVTETISNDSRSPTEFDTQDQFKSHHQALPMVHDIIYHQPPFEIPSNTSPDSIQNSSVYYSTHEDPAQAASAYISRISLKAPVPYPLYPTQDHQVPPPPDIPIPNTPYPMDDDPRSSMRLPSEKQQQQQQKQKLPSEVLPDVSNSSQKVNLSSMNKQKEHENIHLKPMINKNKGISSLKYGPIGDSDISDSESHSRLSDVNTSVISEVISSGEALEIKLPGINTTMMNTRRADHRPKNLTLATSNFHKDGRTDLLNISPTLPLTPHKSGFLSSISESLKSPEKEISINRILRNQQGLLSDKLHHKEITELPAMNTGISQIDPNYQAVSSSKPIANSMQTYLAGYESSKESSQIDFRSSASKTNSISYKSDRIKLTKSDSK